MQKAARSKFFSVILLPFQEHQAVESASFHQLSVFFYTSISLSYCTGSQVEEILFFFTLLFVNYSQKASCNHFIKLLSINCNESYGSARSLIYNSRQTVNLLPWNVLGGFGGLHGHIYHSILKPLLTCMATTTRIILPLIDPASVSVSLCCSSVLLFQIYLNTSTDPLSRFQVQIIFFHLGANR